MAKILICSACGTTGKPKSETPGSILIEIILWLCFIVPGLIYSIWRHTKRHDVCRSCGAAQLLPAESPAGRALAEKYKTA